MLDKNLFFRFIYIKLNIYFIKIFDFTNFKIYFYKIIDILGEEKRKIPFLLFQFIFLSCLEIFGLGIIAPFINLLLNPNSIDFLWLNRYLGKVTQENLLIAIGCLLLLIFLIKNIVSILIYRNIFRFSGNQLIRIRAKLIQTYQTMPYEIYLQRNSSEYMQSITDNTLSFSKTLDYLCRVVSDIIIVIFIFIFLAFEHSIALFFLIILLGGAGWWYDYRFRDLLKTAGEQQAITHKQVFKKLSESIAGFKEIRILGKEKIFSQPIDENSRGFVNARVTHEILTMIPRYFMETLLLSFVIILSIILMMMGSVSELLMVLGVFGMASLRLLPSVNKIISQIATLRILKYRVESLWEDIQDLRVITIDNFNLKKQNENFQKLELKNAYFRYLNTNKWALKNINLVIKKGEILGIIGISGSGKTTLIDVLLGLLKIEKGQLIYNEHLWNEREMQNWRSQIAYLPQQIFIIDETIKENVALGVSKEKIDEYQVEIALKQANLLSVVKQLPYGLNTLLGERGIRLSGGQRQRIALARAFYHNREVLIMDESTSALDHETEKEVVNEILKLKGKKTIIMIAHRLTTLQHCNRIIQLDNSQITRQVTYEELIKI